MTFICPQDVFKCALVKKNTQKQAHHVIFFYDKYRAFLFISVLLPEYDNGNKITVCRPLLNYK